MTHGCGTISSGGGGRGFSGGAHSSRRSKDSDSGACLGYIIYALLCLIAFFFCIPKMTPNTRIVLTWIWVSAASMTTGVLVANYGDQSLTDSPWDMRKVDKLSSWFCSSVSIGSSSEMNTYLLTWSPPVISAQFRENTETYSSYIEDNSYEYWGFYFIEGSSVDIAVSNEGDESEFLVIKGKSNLDKWKDNSDCTDCYQTSVDFIGSYGDIFDFDKTDQYYFLFANKDFGSSIDVTFGLKRKYYDVTPGLMYCDNEKSCAIDLVIGASFSIIIEAPKDSPNDIDVTVTCRPRAYLYVLVFGMVPALIGIGVSLGIYKYSKRGQTATSQTDSSDSRSRILGGEEQGSDGNVNYGVRPYDESVSSTR